MTPWLKLMRLYYAVPFAGVLVLTVVYARSGDMAGRWTGALLAGFALMLVHGGANAINDAVDLAIDRINAPHRPIPSGRVTRSAAFDFGVALTILGLGVGVLARPAFAVGLAVLALGLAGYNRWSKRLGLLKAFAVATLTVSLYPLAVLQAGELIPPRAGTLAVFPAWLWLNAAAYELLKDAADVGGDALSATGRRLSPAGMTIIARVLVVLGLPLVVLPGLDGCGLTYLAIVGVAVAAGLLAVVQTSPRRGMIAIAVELILVGIAATVDLLV